MKMKHQGVKAQYFFAFDNVQPGHEKNRKI